jgi:hypothetical protein
MTLQLHRPDGKGGLEPTPVPPDYRTQLRSPRWGRALGKGQMPRMSNPDMRPTNVLISMGFWAGLAFATFVIVALGYGIGFWH